MGIVLWFTGLPCSGKTTLAKLFKEILEDHEYKVRHLDGDEVRKTICSDLGFSKEDRAENLRRITELAIQEAHFYDYVICTFVSPYREQRMEIKRDVTNAGFLFLEVFVKAELDECIRRDVKGMYAKAVKGEIANFTGISDPYEEPSAPDIIIHSDFLSIEESLAVIAVWLRRRQLV